MVLPQQTPSTPGLTVFDLCKRVLVEADWIAQDETPNASDAKWVLDKMNDLLDEWSNRKMFIPNLTFAVYTMIPNKSPHTIGPGNADFLIPSRPVKLESVSIVLNTSNPVNDIPIPVRDDDWWAMQRVKFIGSSVPTDVYYSADWPQGLIYFWPVPTVAYQCRLGIWGILLQFANLTDLISLPSGYRKAIVLSVAEELAGPRSNDPQLMRSADLARRNLQMDNLESPETTTTDSGMPASGKRRGGFNWITGNIV